jgi:hypothetical protein
MSDIQIAIETLQREHPDWKITNETFFENKAIRVVFPSEGLLNSNYNFITTHQFNYFPNFSVMSYEMEEPDTGDEAILAVILDEELYSFSRLLYTLTKELRDEHFRNQRQSETPVQQQDLGTED